MKITIHLPDAILEALDRIASREFASNRSAAAVAALLPFLKAYGEHPDDPSASELHAMVDTLLREVGPATLKAALEDIAGAPAA